MKRKKIAIISLMLFTLVFAGCGAGNTFGAEVAVSSEYDVAVTYDEEDSYFNWQEGEYTSVSLEEGSASITESGVYELTGTLAEGSLTVNVDKSEDEGTVFLVMNNASIASNVTAPINILEAKKVVLILEPGTENAVSMGKDIATDDSGNPSAAIFTKADMTITGDGSLTVTTQFNDGITSKDDLKITGGKITVNAAQDGIVGKDLLAVRTAEITIDAGKDGMRSTNSEEEGKGNVVIQDGTFKITAANDGIQAEQVLQIDGGTFDLTCGGGAPEQITKAADHAMGGMGMRGTSEGAIRQKRMTEMGTPPAIGWENTSSQAIERPTSSSAIETEETEAESMKGLKAATATVIKNGEFTISSNDDAVHSNGDVIIFDGTFDVETGDDGIHADKTVTIKDGTITVAKSYEGIEGQNIAIEGGAIKITASDDGINVNDSAGALTISGGEMSITAGGDGVDSNGNIVQKGGKVVIDTTATGPGDTAVDYDGTFTAEGGTLIDQNGDAISHQPGMAGGRGGKPQGDMQMPNGDAGVPEGQPPQTSRGGIENGSQNI